MTHLALFVVAIERWLVQPSLANLLGFSAAVVVGYAGHALWTFPRAVRSQRDVARTMPRFLATALFGLALNAAIVAVTVEWLRRSHWLAVLLMAGVTPACVYLLSRHWAFAAPGSPDPGAQDKRP